jgi:hypothetical protein
MRQRSYDQEREQRITMEIVVDAYTPQEQVMGGYYSREDGCASRLWPGASPGGLSPLCVGDEVEVVGAAPEEECQHELFVLIRWERRGLAVPLAQLEGVGGRADPPGDRGLALLGRSGVRAVSNVDLEEGTAWRLAIRRWARLVYRRARNWTPAEHLTSASTV